jgi:benzoate transport
MSNDPREILNSEPMGWFQMTAVGICVMLNALDGFDVLAISFASPGIATEWGVDRGMLGIVLSMELIGMAVGSIVMGPIADRIGRRPTILLCLVMMATGMYLASVADSVESLSAFRFFTGLGIGGMLAAINAMAAEYANDRYRKLSVIVMATGYPIGVIVGGSIASVLLASFDWRSIFVFGSLVTLTFIPVVWFLLPESIGYLTDQRPKQALERINTTLKRMGHRVVDAMPALDEGPKQGISQLFSKNLLNITLLLTAAYFFHIMTFYFILKWIPKIVVDMGFTPSLAGSVLVWASVGGAAGSIALGLLTQRFAIKRLVMGAFMGAAIMVVVFGQGQADLFQLSVIAGIAGMFTNSAIVGLYAMFAESFPTEVRAGGTGFVIGVGRGGAALGPVIAGFMFEANLGLETVAIVMAMGSIFAAIALARLKLPSRQPA